MSENKRFSCEVIDTGLFRNETITDNYNQNAFDDVETATELLNKFYDEDKKLKSKIQNTNEAVAIAADEQIRKVFSVINHIQEKDRINAKKCREQGNVKKAIKFEESVLTLSVLKTELKKEMGKSEFFIDEHTIASL